MKTVQHIVWLLAALSIGARCQQQGGTSESASNSSPSPVRENACPGTSTPCDTGEECLQCDRFYCVLPGSSCCDLAAGKKVCDPGMYCRQTSAGFVCSAGDPPPAPTPTPPPPPVTESEWIGFANSPNIDRDDELRRRCLAPTFRRVPGPPSSVLFRDLCTSVGKACTTVCDWEGNAKSCDERSQSAPDGSRIAFCGPAPTSGATEGWYGFLNAPNSDRNSELIQRCQGGRAPLNRTLFVGGWSFHSLCRTLNMRCDRVCDWEGNIKDCSENSNNGQQDGSRVAYCTRW
jgi:hypothetical protein